MKVKILVSSTSRIDKIEHPEAISQIPDLIKYNDQESYLDDVDITNDMFLNRLKYGKAKAELTSPSLKYVKDLFEKTFNEGYDTIIYVLPAGRVVCYDDNLLDFIYEYPNVKLYFSKLVGYALAFSMLDLYSSIVRGTNVDDALAQIKKKENLVHLAIFSPTSDALNIRDLSKNNFPKMGRNRVYFLECSSLIEIREEEMISFNDFLKNYLKYLDEGRLIPYIEYSSINSFYVEYVEKKLISIFPELKEIKKYALAPSVLNVVGPNAIGLGFIKLS